jgi:hypothetical protein
MLFQRQARQQSKPTAAVAASQKDGWLLLVEASSPGAKVRLPR